MKSYLRSELQGSTQKKGECKCMVTYYEICFPMCLAIFIEYEENKSQVIFSMSSLRETNDHLDFPDESRIFCIVL